MNNPRGKTTYDRILETVSVLILCGTIFPFLHFGKLTENNVPVHFGINGQADGWGSPYLLWFIPAIVVIIYIGLTYIEKQYKKFNYPVKIKNEEVAGIIYRLGVRLIRHIKLIVTAIFCYMGNCVFLVATHKAERLYVPVFYLLTGSMFIVILFYLIKMIRLKKQY